MAEKFHPTQIRKLGFILFAISFVTPTWNFEGVTWGFGIFYLSGKYIFETCATKIAFADLGKGLHTFSLVVAWFANFTIFLKRPKVIVYVALISPWIFQLIWTTELFSGSLTTEYLSIIPFWPWAIGISLIQISKLIEDAKATRPD